MWCIWLRNYSLKAAPIHKPFGMIFKKYRDKTLQSIQYRWIALQWRHGGEMEGVHEIREMEIKISLNKDIILVPKEETELRNPTLEFWWGRSMRGF